jgi:hypothetical protein
VECQLRAWRQIAMDERQRANAASSRAAELEAEIMQLGGRVIRVKHELLETREQSSLALEAAAVSARQALEQLQQDMRTCVICQDRARSVLLLTCGHWQLCEDCYAAMPQRRCPCCDVPFHAKRVKKGFALFV